MLCNLDELGAHLASSTVYYLEQLDKMLTGLRFSLQAASASSARSSWASGKACHNPEIPS